MTERRTVRITLDVDIGAQPRDEWQDELEELFDGDGDSDLDDAPDDWPLKELSTGEVADCIEQATYDPEIFAGSMLYLRVLETRVVRHELVTGDDVSSTPAPSDQRGPQ